MSDLESIQDWFSSWLAYIADGRAATDVQSWAGSHPDEVIVGGSLLGGLLALSLVALGVAYRHRARPVDNESHTREPSLMPEFDLESRLGVSREDLAEVGLPLQTSAPGGASVAPVSQQNLKTLNDMPVEHLMVIARYCLSKGDMEAAREAIGPIVARGNPEERRAALTLLEDS